LPARVPTAALPGAARTSAVRCSAITFDSATNLEWLDLTATLGLSYNQALTTTYVTSQGFAHASVGDVQTLFVNAGFVSTNNASNHLNDPAAALLLSLMGCTQFCGTSTELGRGFADSTSPGWFTRSFYRSSPLGAGAATISLQTSDKDLVATNIPAGHFLVRQAQVQVSAVPEPEIYAMMGLGLGLIGWIGRRKKLKEAAAA